MKEMPPPTEAAMADRTGEAKTSAEINNNLEAILEREKPSSKGEWRKPDLLEAQRPLSRLLHQEQPFH